MYDAVMREERSMYSEYKRFADTKLLSLIN